MSTAPATPAPAPASTPAEKLQEKLLALRARRIPRQVRQTKVAAQNNNLDRLLTPKDRKRLARTNRKEGVANILQKFGITDPHLKAKVVQGIQNGTLGSHPELERFITQERQRDADRKATEAAALNLPDEKVSSACPVNGFVARKTLRAPGVPIVAPALAPTASTATLD